MVVCRFLGQTDYLKLSNISLKISSFLFSIDETIADFYEIFYHKFSLLNVLKNRKLHLPKNTDFGGFNTVVCTPHPFSSFLLSLSYLIALFPHSATLPLIQLPPSQAQPLPSSISLSSLRYLYRSPHNPSTCLDPCLFLPSSTLHSQHLSSVPTHTK